MIKKFEIKNMNTMKSATFGMDIDCDFVFPGDEGVDWGNVPVNHHTYNYPSQVGDSISSSKINNRDVSIIGYAYYMLNEDELNLYNRDQRDEYAYENIKKKKELLNNLINPQDFIRIIVGDYYLEGKPSASPKYSPNESENNTYFCRFMIEIFCANPMFHKNTETITILSGESGGFHFPFILTPNKYIMGTRVNYLMLLVNNEGNATIGGKIILEAKDTIVNPVIVNSTTGEEMRINKTMIAGEKIIVNTQDGEERGIYGYTIEGKLDYLKYWDFDNDWIKFEQGHNIINYSTENQSETMLDVSIELNPEKFGLEEM